MSHSTSSHRSAAGRSAELSQRRKSGVAPLLAATAAAVLTLSGTVLTTPALADPGPQTTDRHVVVLVNFRNASLAHADADREAARKNFFGSADSLTTYYAANSGNRFGVVPAKGDGVFGPFTLDMDGSGCETSKMAELARKTIPDVTYDHLSIVMPSTDACQWWGLGMQPGNVTWFQEGAVESQAAIFHEIGHNLGFAHEERQVCPAGAFTSCSEDGYSDRTPMGGGGEKKGLSAPELMSRKWLTEQQIAAPTSTTTVHLTPLHAAGASGVRAVDLPLGTTGDRIVVEYRTPDAGTLDKDVAQGVDVFRAPHGNYEHSVMIGNGRHDEKSVVGSFTGSAALTDTASGLSVSVVGMTADGADVRIQLGAGPNPTPTPTSVTASPTAPAPTATATATATPKPGSATPTQQAPTAPAPTSATKPAEDVTAIGVTGSPRPAAPTTASASPTANGDSALASTGAKVATPGLIGAALVAVGGSATILLRRRRTAQHRKH
ncbi:hypothetical protein F7Q99_20365 [Streptomyces kaniharaensis]|uniref:Peptidase M11 gametolysin domain-containing protein n=1 Tax=Streptomyces kaniharaensis TaxID=212423 RepID=A0A6N7KX27_9ACTN|nr:hypothetical protein [Streptomyces kaniharaensis]MQS14554.1 hypothetical protein [Streptomyces kaniharaensis]